MPDTLEPGMRDRVIDVLRTIFDPEIPVNIYDMGLIYSLEIGPKNVVHVRMTLTTPACPVAVTLPPQVASKIKTIEGVADATVEVVWDPPWTLEKMSEAARLQLNLDLDPAPKSAPEKIYTMRYPH